MTAAISSAEDTVISSAEDAVVSSAEDAAASASGANPDKSTSERF
jgi:hypothetical protein